MLKEHKGTWVSVLPAVELAINSTVNDGTGYSPFYVAYGQEATKPADLLEGLSPNPAAGDFANRIATIYPVVRTQLEKAKASQKHQADKRRHDASFQVGDHVLLDTRNLPLPETHKLADRYVGPFRITAKVGPTVYCLELPANMAIHDVFHIGLLKPYQQPSSSFPLPQPHPIIVDGEQEWEIEAIKSHRTVRGKQ